MSIVYALAVLFLGWLAVMAYRFWLQVREKKTKALVAAGGAAGEIRESPGRQYLAVLLQDRSDYVEGFVRRLAAGRERYPVLKAVLVDGGSSDDTALILERLARRFDMLFCHLSELDKDCVRKNLAKPSCAGDIAYQDCRGACFLGKDVKKTVLCLDLRSASGRDLLKFNLYKPASFSFRYRG